VLSPELPSTPVEVHLELTSRCNARCTYCYYLDNDGVRYEDVATAVWLRFFDELAEAKVLRASLAGGEPLMRPDFLELVRALGERNVRFSVATNGWFATRELAEALAATRRCDGVQVSLDGSTAAVHERLRGPGTFAPALLAVRLFLAAGLPTTVRVTVNAGNLDDLPALASLLLDELALPSFSTNSVTALGSHRKYEDGSFLTPRQRLRAMRVLTDLERLYPGRIQAAAGPLADARQFAAMERAAELGEPLPGRGRLVGCSCMLTQLAVRADGAYVPCVALPQIVLGRIGRDRLRDFWNRAPALLELRARRDLSLREFPECAGCEYLESCTGNCAGAALSLLGDANRPSPDACLRRFKAELSEAGIEEWR
jgi:SynChlorMet cassette radical SAM/SPASM protein ScmE